jgi:hypothetical protein
LSVFEPTDTFYHLYGSRKCIPLFLKSPYLSCSTQQSASPHIPCYCNINLKLIIPCFPYSLKFSPPFPFLD